MTKSTRILLALVVSLIGSGRSVRAAVKPHGLFTEGAVLQQGMDVPVWGDAKDGEKVTVTFQGQEMSTVASNGQWRVNLKPLKPGGPFPMTIAGENKIELKNILVGEVWVCSGQSNMHYPLRQASGSTNALADCADSQLRLLTVPESGQKTPERDLTAAWKECEKSSAGAFSAIAYYFGRDLRKDLKVPVGLIHASVGGTGVQFWMSWRAVEADPEFHDWVEARDRADRTYEESLAKYQKTEPELLEKWKAAAAKAEKDGKPVPTKPAPPKKAVPVFGKLYNGMIAPLQPYAIRGAIWFQGEANSTTAAAYPRSFLGMIKGWRRDWGLGDFPFLFGQLGPFVTPEIREAQLHCWQKSTNTAMVVSADCNAGAREVHFPLKEPVGVRLALAARAVAYGEKVEYSGPIYDSMKIDGERVILSFRHTGKGLVARGGDLQSITIAGADSKFVKASARIDGAKIVVTSPDVKVPVAVRYGWDVKPELNLFSEEGLPASPFRTDTPVTK